MCETPTVAPPTQHHDDNRRTEGMSVSPFLHLLLAEGPTKANLWNPTIIGVLTVLCAVGLFCGSVYLLLGTNLGARLGFLVAAAGLYGLPRLAHHAVATTPGSDR